MHIPEQKGKEHKLPFTLSVPASCMSWSSSMTAVLTTTSITVAVTGARGRSTCEHVRCEHGPQNSPQQRQEQVHGNRQ